MTLETRLESEEARPNSKPQHLNPKPLFPNRISKIENLESLCRLKKLDIGKNRISRVEGLENLTNLAQLSLEDNEIESLVGLSALSTLLELYVGNNKIGDMREILHLKVKKKPDENSRLLVCLFVCFILFVCFLLFVFFCLFFCSQDWRHARLFPTTTTTTTT